jgi:hypothetical protein
MSIVSKGRPTKLYQITLPVTHRANRMRIRRLVVYLASTACTVKFSSPIDAQPGLLLACF